MTNPIDLYAYIRDVHDYPQRGVVFKDITPLLASGRAFDAALQRLVEPFRETPVDLIAGIESRGFIFASAIARELGAGFVPVRKPGKLPRATLRQDYQLEYGHDAVEIHGDAVAPGQRVLIVDDVLATGGTLAATLGLLAQAGARVVGSALLIELTFLAPRRRLPPGAWTHSVLEY